MATKDKQAADYIVPLNMNGLEGRMLHMPAPKAHPNREILIVYGHHSSIERWWGLTQNFNRYGAVTMPDLPGFGGMESMYNIGKKPDLDNMADYLASFVKWRYKRKRVSIVGLSFGFLVTTRMLQRYPELVKKVDFLISAVGFSHYDDFVFTKPRMMAYRIASRAVTTRPMAFLFRYIALDPAVLRLAYKRTFNAKKKFAGADADLSKRLMDMEIVLWHANDPRTHMYTTYQMLTVDNCQNQIDLPVWHVSAGVDQYFDAHRVEQHLRVIFKDFHEIRNDSVRHAPSVLADAKEAASFIPHELRRALQKK
jgi:pimeloyl-ACP methyl ester carboxylesterase